MKNNNDIFKSFAMIIQLGLSMLAPVILCIALGNYIEGKFHISVTAPLVILGILAGCRNTWILAKSVTGGTKKKKEDESDNGDGDSKDE